MKKKVNSLPCCCCWGAGNWAARWTWLVTFIRHIDTLFSVKVSALWACATLHSGTTTASFALGCTLGGLFAGGRNGDVCHVARLVFTRSAARKFCFTKQYQHNYFLFFVFFFLHEDSMVQRFGLGFLFSFGGFSRSNSS